MKEIIEDAGIEDATTSRRSCRASTTSAVRSLTASAPSPRMPAAQIFTSPTASTRASEPVAPTEKRGFTGTDFRKLPEEQGTPPVDLLHVLVDAEHCAIHSYAGRLRTGSKPRLSWASEPAPGLGQARSEPPGRRSSSVDACGCACSNQAESASGKPSSWTVEGLSRRGRHRTRGGTGNAPKPPCEWETGGGWDLIEHAAEVSHVQAEIDASCQG